VTYSFSQKGKKYKSRPALLSEKGGKEDWLRPNNSRGDRISPLNLEGKKKNLLGSKGGGADILRK